MKAKRRGYRLGSLAVEVGSTHAQSAQVDWAGRQIREDKVGSINSAEDPILKRSSSPEHWVYLCTRFESRFKGLVGSVYSLKTAYDHFSRQRVPNLSASTTLFN